MSTEDEEAEGHHHGVGAIYLLCAKLLQAFGVKKQETPKSSGEARSRLTVKYFGMSTRANRHLAMRARLRE